MDRVQGFDKRARRIDLRRPAVLIDATGGESSVIILDVSSGDFRLELTELPRIGELVTLWVEHGEEFPAQPLGARGPDRRRVPRRGRSRKLASGGKCDAE
jgi:hypothetical protein